MTGICWFWTEEPASVGNRVQSSGLSWKGPEIQQGILATWTLPYAPLTRNTSTLRKLFEASEGLFLPHAPDGREFSQL